MGAFKSKEAWEAQGVMSSKQVEDATWDEIHRTYNLTPRYEDDWMPESRKRVDEIIEKINRAVVVEDLTWPNVPMKPMATW